MKANPLFYILLLVLFMFSCSEDTIEQIEEILSEPSDFAIGDLDGDNFIDIVIQESNATYFFINNRNGGFGDPILLNRNYSSSNLVNLDLKIVDINGDSKNDIIGLVPDAGTVIPDGSDNRSFKGRIALFINEGNKVFTLKEIQLQTGRSTNEIVIDFKVLDLNGDKKPDLVYHILDENSRDKTEIAWYANLGNNSFGSVQKSLLGYSNFEGIYSEDLTNDGINEVLILSFWETSRIFNVAKDEVISFDRSGMFRSYAAIADFDLNGWKDVFAHYTFTDKSYLYKNSASRNTLDSHINDYVSGGVQHDLEVAYINDDNFPELIRRTGISTFLSYENRSNLTGWDFNDAEATDLMIPYKSGGSNSTNYKFIDIDNDGDSDFIGINDPVGGTEELIYVLNNGGVFSDQKLVYSN